MIGEPVHPVGEGGVVPQGRLTPDKGFAAIGGRQGGIFLIGGDDKGRRRSRRMHRTNLGDGMPAQEPFEGGRIHAGNGNRLGIDIILAPIRNLIGNVQKQISLGGVLSAAHIS